MHSYNVCYTLFINIHNSDIIFLENKQISINHIIICLVIYNK